MITLSNENAELYLTQDENDTSLAVAIFTLVEMLYELPDEENTTEEDEDGSEAA